MIGGYEWVLGPEARVEEKKKEKMWWVAALEQRPARARGREQVATFFFSFESAPLGLWAMAMAMGYGLWAIAPLGPICAFYCHLHLPPIQPYSTRFYSLRGEIILRMTNST